MNSECTKCFDCTVCMYAYLDFNTQAEPYSYRSGFIKTHYVTMPNVKMQTTISKMSQYSCCVISFTYFIIIRYILSQNSQLLPHLCVMTTFKSSGLWEEGSESEKGNMADKCTVVCLRQALNYQVFNRPAALSSPGAKRWSPEGWLGILGYSELPMQG